MVTALNIGAVTPDRKPMLKPKSGPCPSCASGPDKRVAEGSFGTNGTRVLCGNCGYEFKE